ncbi:TonB-dependent receptor [Marinibactrum halimedae]|uniref:Oar protein n=1 Tax=Marinibactrum halimedae TaxID=1444977 RepID=A0AA37T5U8_9GAMM|nr:TonB-dependent receptor [Marinibactrum halimedae]MCD9460482.1 TonB-dependent receptor [Marinibactrum halimedae]GLS25888.1 Oar protein [Marinibactrum halimedae]
MKAFYRNPLTYGVLLALSTTVAQAQETSSSISGYVSTPTGEPAANTTVIILHVPSNTLKTFETNSGGRYSAKGLRVGGPYRITIDSDTYDDTILDELYLQLDQTLTLNTQLESQSIEELTVIAEASAYERNTGTESLFNAVTVEVSPSMDRDLKDVIRINPLAVISNNDESSLSIAGINPRYNSLTVDGINQNDEFGLNNGGYPTQRSPISTQAVEAVSVSLAPFNARSSGFSGGQINAVTKSGSNEFHGSFFYERRDSEWGGEAESIEPGSNDVDVIELEYERTNWGATFSGPIMEDSLFFFLSYEFFEEPTFQEWGPTGSGRPNEVYLTEEQYDEIRQIGLDVYGIDVGDWRLSPQEEDEKILAKIDWNINEDHRASLTYQYTNGNRTILFNSSLSRFNSRSNAYDLSDEMTNYAIQWYGYWSDNFSTEFSLAYKDLQNGQDPYTDLPSISIDAITRAECDSGNDGLDPCETFVRLGTDTFRHANELENQRLNLEIVGEYLLDKHTLNFGLKWEQLDIENLFVPGSKGSYRFNSIEDFQNGLADRITYSNSFRDNPNDVAVEIDLSTLSLFVQDDWFITPDLEMNIGLRYETTISDSEPEFNENFSARNGFSNQENLDGVDIFLPRIGFRWTPSDDITISGGLGRYSGGRPNVWLGNSWRTDGVTYIEAADLTNFSITRITPLPNEILFNEDGNGDSFRGNGSVELIDPDFELPSDWRAVVSVDAELPQEWQLNVAYTRIEGENEVIWVDLAREASLSLAQQDGQPLRRTVDGGRIIYPTATYPVVPGMPGNTDIMLTNADDNGYSNIFTVALNKYWDNGFSLNLSYASQDVTSGNNASDSSGVRNLRFSPSINRNEVEIGRSLYEIEHRFVLNLTYATTFIADLQSTFNLFFERRSGTPFNYTLGVDFDRRTNDVGRIVGTQSLGDQGVFFGSEYYLPYIPFGPDDPAVAFGENNSLSYEEIMARAASVGADRYAGGYAEKHTGRTPWISQMDFKFTQEIPGFMETHRGRLELTVRNVFDFLDETGIYSNDHGVVRESEFSDNTLFDFDINDQGQYVYYIPEDNITLYNWDTYNAEASTWELKLGVVYEF